MNPAASIHAARAPHAADLELLRRRAAVIARIPRRDEGEAGVPAVVIRLGRERYAIEAVRVLEVTVLRELTPLPGAPPPLLGVTHWRGDILTVLDLRALLGVRTPGLTDLRRLVVIAGARRPFGVLADETQGIIAIETGRLKRTARTDEESRFVAGMTHDAVLLLDADALVGAHTGRPTTTRG